MTFDEIEDILLSMDLKVDISYYTDENSEPTYITIESILFEDLVNQIYNRIHGFNRNRVETQFLIMSKYFNEKIKVDELIKILEEFKKEKGNFDVVVSSMDLGADGFLKTCNEKDKHRPYLYGYTKELTDKDIINICIEELQVFKTHLRTQFWDYNALLECKSIKNVLLEKIRADKLKRIIK